MASEELYDVFAAWAEPAPPRRGCFAFAKAGAHSGGPSLSLVGLSSLLAEVKTSSSGVQQPIGASDLNTVWKRHSKSGKGLQFEEFVRVLDALSLTHQVLSRTSTSKSAACTTSMGTSAYDDSTTTATERNTRDSTLRPGGSAVAMMSEQELYMPWQPWMRTLKEALTVLRRGSSQLQRPASLPQHTGSASGVARVSATAGGGVACPSVSENEGDSSYSQMQLLGGQNSADADAEQPTPCQMALMMVELKHGIGRMLDHNRALEGRLEAIERYLRSHSRRNAHTSSSGNASHSREALKTAQDARRLQTLEQRFGALERALNAAIAASPAAATAAATVLIKGVDPPALPYSPAAACISETEPLDMSMDTAGAGSFTGREPSSTDCCGGSACASPSPGSSLYSLSGHIRFMQASNITTHMQAHAAAMPGAGDASTPLSVPLSGASSLNTPFGINVVSCPQMQTLQMHTERAADASDTPASTSAPTSSNGTAARALATAAVRACIASAGSGSSASASAGSAAAHVRWADQQAVAAEAARCGLRVPGAHSRASAPASFAASSDPAQRTRMGPVAAPAAGAGGAAGVGQLDGPSTRPRISLPASVSISVRASASASQTRADVATSS